MDIAILRKLDYEGANRQSLRAIARSLDLDEKTVRTRLRKLEETFLKGQRYVPNVRLFGRRMATYLLLYEDPAVKAEARERLKLLEGITGIKEALRSLQVDLLHRTDGDLGRQLRLVEELAGVRPQKLFDQPTPEVRTLPSRLDWQILSVLRSHPEWSPREVGKELGVTARTVRNRLNRLLRKGAVLRVPLMDARDIEGRIMYVLTCFFEEGAERNALATFQEALADKAVCHFAASDEVAQAAVAAEAQREPEETYHHVASRDGVSEAYLDFPQGQHDCSEAFDQLIEEELARLEAG